MNSIRGCLAALLLFANIGRNEGCMSGDNTLGTGGYRNYLLEATSNTYCGKSGEMPVGVCVPPRACGLMSGIEQGTFNCPILQSSCCQPVATCNATTRAATLRWQSERYVSDYRLQKSNCQLRVIPSSDTCYIRVDFDDADFESTKIGECQSSTLTIKGQAEGDGSPICGTLNHKNTFVKVGRNMIGIPNQVIFDLKMEHVPHKYSIRFNHILCSDIQRFNNPRLRMASIALERTERAMRRQNVLEPAYMGRMYAVAYTEKPYITSCPVVFIAKDIVLGAASCALRLGGPGTSKGMMVVHGNPHVGPRSSFPTKVSTMAKYVAANGVVVEKTAIHPGYVHSTHVNDFAIYHLQNPIGAVEPVKLPLPFDKVENLNVFMSRYRTYKMSKDVTILADAEELPTRVLNNKECKTNSLSSVASVMSNNTICIASTPRKDSPCKGEPGSPIVHVGSSGDVTLIGLMMGNYHPCEKRDIEYAEPALHIINYLEFIDVATSPALKVAPVERTTSLTEWLTSLWPTPTEQN